MKTSAIAIILFFVSVNFAQNNFHRLAGFSNSPYYNEQIKIYNIHSDVRVFINAPSAEAFDPEKPVRIILYALPNGNSIEHTIGKVLNSGDDWHFDIQHIGAQTRFLRNSIQDNNIVTVYLETSQKSWPTWKSQHSDHAALIKGFVESIKTIFADYSPSVVLNGHSGGGRFIFSFLDAHAEVPSYVKRISFLDSNYGYEHSYGSQIVNWLNASSENVLCVIAYNDSVALYNGEPIVSPTGGTWYRSRIMKTYMSSYFSFINEEDDEFIRHTALEGRIKFILKKNPLRQILHTVQVEKNGFIQSICQATDREGIGYTYYSDRAYSQYIQNGAAYPAVLNIPPRLPGAKTGTEFMQYVLNMNFAQREEQIFAEISAGNVPDFLRNAVNISATFTDLNGVSHSVVYNVLPDYLAIGSDDDFCRIPMGPITAQKLADLFGATMPTRKLVDNIYAKSSVKLQPVTYTPVGNQNELVPKFILHNRAIDSLRILTGGELGELTGGTKKDVVISNLILDPTRPDHVVIYGWHQLNGSPIQPLTNIHINTYVDYSHGIRFLGDEFLLDGELANITNILQHDILYKVLSDETGPMPQPSYLAIAGLPGQPRSFGVKSTGSGTLLIVSEFDPDVESYDIEIGTNGTTFDLPVNMIPPNLFISGLENDKVYYIRMKAVNSIGKSPVSEVLSGSTIQAEPQMIIVNGFDRTSTGNTFNFIRMHAPALHDAGVAFVSATNDAVLDGLFSLSDYPCADYILGDESTVDETFSLAEQNLIKLFLRQGGKLFVSGSEIAWDLDYKGSTSDKDFIWNYLKVQYAADAPNNVSGTYYTAQPIAGGIYDGLGNITFDNGTHGTINVKWPDVFIEKNGGTGNMKYAGLSTTALSGISYSGMFTGGTSSGKVVILGFPFETIYPVESRNSIMQKILNYFEVSTSLVNQPPVPVFYLLSQNYPNPFNPSTTIDYELPVSGHVNLIVFDLLGRKVAELVNEEKSAGSYRVLFNANHIASGTYFYSIKSGNFRDTKKLLLLR
ncbi:MAG: T9SS type A sorting domain-containing protein [Ignavibacteriales bacterium]|nr:T9SS type A sorting domain-containing protein [Ignavibacteriales bacterium]MCF8305822.1 T9SS type A sorting domain-containing protein [Ignavibacteriales bacterium]MCF8315544.1 T9SS type A sorting domain-containing protein [Ignavibacteriales bacterium]MCF8436926.1 T9SS type A sorting domain-containing protein [Ignavibacteriales bacterium]